jgi:anti-sigma factor RsiW
VSGHVRESLSAYLDHELGRAERAAVEAHLVTCTECSALLEQLGLVDAALRALPVPATTGDDAFAARVRARIEAEDPRAGHARGRAPAARRILPPWTWAAAALLAVITPLTLHELRAPRADAVAPAAKPESSPVSPASLPAASREAMVAPEMQARLEEEIPAEGPARRPRQVVAPRERPANLRNKAFTTPDVFAEASKTRADAGGEGGVPGGVVGGVVGGSTDTRATTFAAAPPAPAPAPAPAIAPVPGLVAKGTATSEAAADAKAAASAEGATFAQLEAQRPRTAAEWRQLRDGWRELARAYPDGPHAEEARVRAIEAAAAAYRASSDAEDARALKRDVAEYLGRASAPHAGRVRQLLREAER